MTQAKDIFTIVVIGGKFYINKNGVAFPISKRKLLKLIENIKKEL